MVGIGEYDGNELFVYDEELTLVKEIKSTERILSLTWRKISDCPNGNKTLYLTQTHFNNDDKFEYVVVISVNDYHFIGLKIISENGNVLQTLNLEKFIYADVVRIGSYDYLCTKIPDDNSSNMFYNLYKINKNINPSKVSIATTPVKIEVSPRVAERNQDITIAAEGEGIREVVVTDASGRTVYSTKAAEGQQTVKLNSLYLSSGLNIVSVKSADGKSENCKVVVKK